MSDKTTKIINIIQSFLDGEIKTDPNTLEGIVDGVQLAIDLMKHANATVIVPPNPTETQEILHSKGNKTIH